MKFTDAKIAAKKIAEKHLELHGKPYVPVVSLRHHDVDSKAERMLVKKGILRDIVGIYKYVEM